MKVGFIGVGLIGGSMLKRLSKCGVDCFVLDINKQVMDAAIKENNAKILTDYSSVDVIVIALSPNNTIKFLEQNATKIGTTLVVDVCGVKNPIEQITNKILASLEEQKIGKISDFSFIAFNFNEQLKERVKVASIGGIYQTINTKELDIDNPDSIQMVENCLDPNRAKFNSYLDVYRGITENISWNRSTYLAYNNVNSLLLKYTKEELDLLVLPTFDPWLKFEKIFDKLGVDVNLEKII